MVLPISCKVPSRFMVKSLPSTDLDCIIILWGFGILSKNRRMTAKVLFCCGIERVVFPPIRILASTSFQVGSFLLSDRSPSPSRVPIARLYGIGRFRVPSEMGSRQRSVVAGKRLQKSRTLASKWPPSIDVIAADVPVACPLASRSQSTRILSSFRKCNFSTIYDQGKQDAHHCHPL